MSFDPKEIEKELLELLSKDSSDDIEFWTDPSKGQAIIKEFFMKKLRAHWKENPPHVFDLNFNEETGNVDVKFKDSISYTIPLGGSDDSE